MTGGDTNAAGSDAADAEESGASAADPVFQTAVRGDVCRLRRPGTRWLSTGHGGGESRADAAYLLSVPEGWDDVDVSGYVADRRRAAGFDGAGPTLLTGVSMQHARRARRGPVEAVVTAGLSNPAALPVPGDRGDTESETTASGADGRRHAGTVNVVVGTVRSLAPGALANLVAVAAEAKAATLLARTGFPGTTSDAVLVGCDPGGERAAFSGSATAVGSAARACVRDALLAALDSRYGNGDSGTNSDGDNDGDSGTDNDGGSHDEKGPPETVDDAEYGVVTDGRAVVDRLDGSINDDSSDG